MTRPLSYFEHNERAGDSKIVALELIEPDASLTDLGLTVEERPLTTWE
jgi:hypothetical protein